MTTTNNDTTPAEIPVTEVTVHPLVLLSAADHYNRVAKGTRKRAVGVLLGTAVRGAVDATNSFAVPFEEDAKNADVFYLDHNYLENMLGMFRKVNAKERVIGFYSTGPSIRPNDLRICQMIKRFMPSGVPGVSSVTAPVFVIIDIRPDRKSIPTTAYQVVEEVDVSSCSNTSAQQGSEIKQTFAHVPSLIGAMEAEEVGVEHLLRDINDPTVSTVTNLIKAKMSGLSSLTEKLVEMKDYLQDVVDDKMKPNQTIINNMQNIVNLLPNLNTDHLVEAMMVKTNDMHMAVYLGALIRSIIALHDLINNKIKYMNADENGEEKKEGEPEKVTEKKSQTKSS